MVKVDVRKMEKCGQIGYDNIMVTVRVHIVCVNWVVCVTRVVCINRVYVVNRVCELGDG